MAALKNVLHERFCTSYAKGILEGLTQGEIYIAAGGATSTQRSAEVLGSRLLKRTDVLARLAEIGKPAVKKAKVDAANLLAKAEHIYEKSKDKDELLGHANRAVELQGRLTGSLIDRSEIRASFDLGELTSVEDVTRFMMSDGFTVDSARAMFADILVTMERIAGDEAEPIPEPPRHKVDETAAVLSVLRPQRR